MEYVIDLDARAGEAAATSNDVAVGVMTHLEACVDGAVVVQNTAEATIGARFVVEAEDAADAARIGMDAFRGALRAAGVAGPVGFARLLVEEPAREEAAAPA